MTTRPVARRHRGRRARPGGHRPPRRRRLRRRRDRWRSGPTAGVEVAYCIVTDGDAGGRPFDRRGPRWPRIRREEQSTAAAGGRGDRRDLPRVSRRPGQPGPRPAAGTSRRVIRQVPARPGRRPVPRAELGPHLRQPSRPPGRRARRPSAPSTPTPATRSPSPSSWTRGSSPTRVPELWIMATDGGGDFAGIAVDDDGDRGAQGGRPHVPQEPDGTDPDAVRARARLGPGAGRVAGLPATAVGRALPGHPHPLRARWAPEIPGWSCSTWRSRAPARSPVPSTDSGAALSVVRVDLGESVHLPPPSADMAGLVVMGGPMGVHDDLPWLADERALLRAAVEAGLPVLGVLPRGPAARRRPRAPR